MRKNDIKKKHKYLKEIGVTPIEENFILHKFSIKDNLRYWKYFKKYKKPGVFPQQTWDMPIALLQWFYEVTSEYVEEASKIVNLNFHKLEYNGKEYTQLELIHLFLDKVKYILVNGDELFLTQEASNNEDTLIQEVYDIWSVLSPHMWW